jgi:hypothetical protein
MSLILDTPPDATSGIFVDEINLFNILKFRPFLVQSLSMSV